MQSLTRLTIFLCCIWAITLLYGEMFAYWIPLWACSWPQVQASENQVKVAILADPQLLDSTSHGLAPKSFALEALQLYTDIYMRRSYFSSILPFDPDLIVFLGDQFDGGPYLSDEEWEGSLNRFKHIFGLNEKRRNFNIPVQYLSGNHDIGYSAYHTQHPEVITRYEREFGQRNYNFSIGKVDFIVVDAQTLDGPTEGTETTSSWEFIKTISKVRTQNPRVLLTHIPLYRPDDTPCGPHRSSPVINQRVYYTAFDKGIRYQNYVSKESSDLLLSLIKPVLVLSGHDHDQCTVTHNSSFGSVIEHTVGTLSWQQGNLYPAFMLMSVATPTDEPKQTVSTQLCFLPWQTHIYIWYLCQFLLTILLLATWPTNGFSESSYIGAIWGSLRKIFSDIISKTKEKDEEEDCEYEMLWDAEGTMHLVKKAAPKFKPSNSNSKTNTRGNVVARPTARNFQLEPGPSVTVELSSEITLDESGKLPRLNKSKVVKLIQRLIRVIRLAVVIAAVNVPIYMMLLFKDWIER